MKKDKKGATRGVKGWGNETTLTQRQRYLESAAAAAAAATANDDDNNDDDDNDNGDGDDGNGESCNRSFTTISLSPKLHSSHS